MIPDSTAAVLQLHITLAIHEADLCARLESGKDADGAATYTRLANDLARLSADIRRLREAQAGAKPMVRMTSIPELEDADA